MAPPKPPPPQACCATHDVIGRVWRTLMRPFRRRGGRRLNWRQLVPGGVGVGSVAGDDYDEDEDDPSEDDDSALLGGSGNSSAEDDSDAAASLLLGDLESNPKESMQHEAHERERKRMLLPVYEKKHELFFAPLSLVTTNGGLVYSAYWCIARELYFEAFAYLFLFLASVAMHGYRDSRSWQWPKQTRNRLVELLMRLDYMAVFHLSCAVSIYLTEYPQNIIPLSRPFLYVASLLLSAFFAFGSTHEKVSERGAIMMLLGVALFLPSYVMHSDMYNGWMLIAVILVQILAYGFIGILQYRIPYWIAHSFWHVFGCTATFMVLLVRLSPTPPS